MEKRQIIQEILMALYCPFATCVATPSITVTALAHLAKAAK
jgi:hypothetical protein